MSGWIGAWGTTATVTDLTVTNSQVISVNTSTNALRITQTGSGNALLVEDDTNPDSSAFVITSSTISADSLTPECQSVLEIHPIAASREYSAISSITTDQS